jgi:hypothetical protein
MRADIIEVSALSLTPLGDNAVILFDYTTLLEMGHVHSRIDNLLRATRDGNHITVG